ncbi:unnamed protein product [Lampetra planeri]
MGAPLPRVDDGWRDVAEQLDSLCTVLIQLVTLVVAPAVPGGGGQVPPPQRSRGKCPPLRARWTPHGRRPLSWARPLGCEEEALDALPTLLDDQALAVFRSIPLEKKKTLKDVYAEMAEVYEPPSDSQQKFMQRTRGSNESPLAYHGALLVVAANPDSNPDTLNPLILGKIMELAKVMGVTLPVCGHEPDVPVGRQMPQHTRQPAALGSDGCLD